MYRKPWEFEPELTRERLVQIAEMLRGARNEAVEYFDEGRGDDNWSLGCRAYAWSKNRLIAAAHNGLGSWLNIRDPSLEFVFEIAGVPFRLFRGDADDPGYKALRTARLEATQTEFDFGAEYHERVVKWRFAVETDPDGAVHRIVVLGFNSANETRCYWEVGSQVDEQDDIHIKGPPLIGGGARSLPEPEVRLREPVNQASDESESEE